MSNQVRYNIGVQHTNMYQAKTINYKTLWIVYYFYVSEHQLPHVIDASHTTPITRDNRGPKLLKLVSWRYCPCFRWVPRDHDPDYWRWTRPYRKVVKDMYNMYNKNKNRTGCQSPPENPAVEPSFGCATYILGHPKYRRCLLHQFSQSQCKLSIYINIYFS